MMLSYTAKDSDEGRKVYSVLRRELELSGSIVKRLKNANAIYLNGSPAYTTVLIHEGDVVSADVMLAERETSLIPEDGDISILFENEGFIVLNKPCGMIVHPSRAKMYGSLAALAAGYFARTGQNAACHVVNRLDRDTSGAVIMAKSAYYKTLLTASLAESSAQKEYTALLYGTLSTESGVIDAPIRRAKPMEMRREVSPEGHRAVTRYSILKTAAAYGETISLASFVLETGRTHQIRVHSSWKGAPLLGDALYGTEASLGLSEKLGVTAQALHAKRLVFRDPVSGRMLEVEAPLERGDMKAVMEGYFGQG